MSNPTTWLDRVREEMRELRRRKERNLTNGGVEDIKNINSIISNLDQMINRYKI